MLKLYCLKATYSMYNPEKQYMGDYFTVFNLNLIFIPCECHFCIMILSSKS